MFSFVWQRPSTKRSTGKTAKTPVKSRWPRRLIIECLETRDLLSVFTVTNTNDSGTGSLRQAILDANANSGADTIQFAIAVSGVQTISPTSPLPTVDGQVVIDGTTEGGFVATPLIEISGAAAGGGANGLTLDGNASGSSVKALVINAFSNDGILLQGTSIKILGCYVGTNAAGTAAQGNGNNGIEITGSADEIGDGTAAGLNVISGNSQSGIVISGSDNVINNNFIGSDVNGVSAIPNGPGGFNQAGIFVTGSTNLITANLISGNHADAGVLLQGAGGGSNVVSLNFIGTTAIGTQALGNSNNGIDVQSSGNLIQANVIGANGNVGITFQTPNIPNAVTGNTVTGNKIGVGLDGSTVLGNKFGVDMFSDTGGQTIGGTTAATRNIISGNTVDGVDVLTPNNLIAGNYIGTDATGTVSKPNTNNGIFLTAAGNTIGGNTAGAGNLISANGGDGVLLTGGGAHTNLLEGNFIGTDVNGTAGLGNGSYGVQFTNAAQNNALGDGNAFLPHANVISGNVAAQVEMDGGGTDSNIVAGNLIGTDKNGTTSLSAMAASGVVITAGASFNIIGADQLSQTVQPSNRRNIISGNNGYGIHISGVATHGNIVGGDYIGVDITGNAALPNNLDGVFIDGGSSSNRIGVSGNGVDDNEEGNVISGNAAWGVHLSGATVLNIVAGNFIGTNAAGTAALANGGGVNIDFGSQNNRIGISGSDVDDVAERNVVSGNSAVGIQIQGSGSSLNIVSGNYIGLDKTGGAALPNTGDGVDLFNSASNNIVGSDGTNVDQRNIISGNSGAGVLLSGDSGDQVTGNYIGTNALGSTALGNASQGILVSTGTNDVIGSRNSFEANVISGNQNDGILLQINSSTVTIQANLIGTNAAGTGGLPNTGDGIAVSASIDTLIGGALPGMTNVISANTGNGVNILTGSSSTVVAGNIIGLDSTGANSLGNLQAGVQINNAAANVIGGANPGDGNVISGNANGVVILSGAGGTNHVLGNRIGTNAAGTAARPNLNDGVMISSGAVGNTIGGVANGAGNLISGNTFFGVHIAGPTTVSNLVLGNFIGTDVTGSLALGNGSAGVFLQNAPRNTIGGATAGDGNVISGNMGDGVFANLSSATLNVIEGNFIGTDATGNVALPNHVGVEINGGASSNFIGGGTMAGGVVPAGVGSVPGLGTSFPGNLISGNTVNGIVISGAGTNGNRVLGNFVGTRRTGFAALANLSDGILVQAGAQQTTIGGSFFGEGNVISGNIGHGLTITGVGTNLNVVQGNYVGLNQAGSAAVPNMFSGIAISGGAQFNLVGTNADGINDDKERNVVSGNGSLGIIIGGSGTQLNTVAGNYVGLNATGASPIPNQASGVEIDNGAQNNTVGGAAPTAGNVLSGNVQAGINMNGLNTRNNLVEGNLIGLNAAGSAAVANDLTGVGIVDGASDNTIGGTSAGARNIISGNQTAGVAVGTFQTNTPAFSNIVIGNYIGTDPAGNAAIPNIGPGVLLADATTGNLIGNGTTGAGNLISGNSQDGIDITGSGTNSNVVYGDFIGTNAAGTAALGNGGSGLVITGTNANSVGGSFGAARNIISGNAQRGVLLVGGTTGIEVINNYIGTDVTGTVAVPNGFEGVGIDGANSNTVGGPLAGNGNLISGNSGRGVDIFGGSSGTVVEGNLIGTDVTGTLALGNQQEGVLIDQASTNNTVGGTSAAARNIISGNAPDGLRIGSGGSTGNVIEGNYIGTNASGAAALANGDFGVEISLGAQNNLIGGSASGAGNVISGNVQTGIFISDSGTTGNIVQGNYIGTDASGTVAVANGGNGVFILRGAQNNQIDNNVASGNGLVGIEINGSGSDNNTVAGNYVGLNASGSAALGNHSSGIGVDGGAQHNTIGGTAAAARNVASGNFLAGIFFQGPGTTNNLAVGNYVGLDATGTAIVANRDTGVAFIDGASNDTLGGATPGARNVISGNLQNGVYVGRYGGTTPASANLIEGNYIGTNAAGTAALGNAGFGVWLIDGTTGNQIGGTAVGAGNLISGNQGDGILVDDSSTGNLIQGNNIGTDVTGAAALPNTGFGVNLSDATSNTVGGTAAVVGNVISGNVAGGVSITRENPAIVSRYHAEGNAVDSISGHNGILENGTSFAPGIAGQAFNFDGVSNDVRVPYNSAFDLNGAVTVEVWVKANPTQFDPTAFFDLVGKSPNFSNGTGWTLEGDAGTGKVSFLVGLGGANNFATLTSSKRILDNQWHQIVAVYYQGTNLRLYVDGMFQGALGLGGTSAANNTGDLFFGENGAGTRHFHGLLDEIGIYHSLLNSSEIAALYAHQGTVVEGTPLVASGSETVQGNFVGTDRTGTVAVPNQGDGVFISNGATSNLIGDTIVGLGNTIAFNGGSGVGVVGATTILNSIRGNSIFSNTGLGIDLGDNGETPNTPGGPHAGPNDLQNFPILLSARPGASTEVIGTLNSTPSKSFTLDFYASPVADPSGFGQGKRYLGSFPVSTDATGNVFFDIFIPGATSPGEIVSATATDPPGADTSEFARAIPSFAAPNVSIHGAPAVGTEGLAINLTSSVTDQDPSATFTYLWTVTKNGNPFASGPEPTFTFTPDQAGSYQVFLTVTDNHGGAGFAQVIFPVSAFDPLVQINGAPVTSVVNTPIPFTSTINNPGQGSTYSYQWTVMLNGAPLPTGPSTNSTFSFTPTAAGLYSVTLTVSSGFAVGAATVNIQVAGLAGVIFGAPPTSLEGIPIVLTNRFSDPNLFGALAYAWTVTKDGAPFAAGNTAVINFTPNDEGSYQVSLTVSDSHGDTAVAAPVTIPVVNANPTATIAGVPVNPPAGTPITLTGAAHDPGSIDQEALQWTVLGSNGQMVAGSTGPIFTFTPGGAGVYVVTLTATDEDGGNGSASVMIAVSQPTRTVSITPPASPQEGSLATFSAAISPSVTPVTFTWSVLGMSSNFSATGTGQTFSFTPFVPGRYQVSVSAGGTPDGSTGSATVVINVANVAPTPTIAVSPGTTVAEGTPVTLTGYASDPGGSADHVSLAWTVTGPDGFAASGSNPTLSFTPIESGSYNVSLSATDLNNATTTTTKVITVTHVTPQPAIKNLGTDATATNLLLAASVPNDPGSDDPFTYSWAAINNNTNQTIATGAASTFAFVRSAGVPYTVNLTVTDDDGGVGSTSASILVAPVGTTLVVGQPALANEVLAFALGNNVIDASAVTGTAVLVAIGGNNTLLGGSGVNILQGDSGLANKLLGGSGSNMLIGTGTDSMTGGSGSNLYMITPGSNQAATAGTGPNTLNFSQAPTGITLDLTQTGSQPIAPGDNLTLSGTFQNLIGSGAADKLTASSGSNLFGGGGNDTLLASGGSNISLFAPTGNALLSITGGNNISAFGGAGLDTLTAVGGNGIALFGGTGNAMLTASGGSNISIFGGAGTDSLAASGATNVTLFGGTGTATLTATNSSNVTLFGGTGNATLTATGGSNVSIFGGSGNASLASSGGTNVTLFGGSGTATLTATNGTNVTLFGGTGNATLTASGGSNISIFGGNGNDSLAASNGTSVTLFGGAGSATLTATNSSNVTLFGGTGNATLTATGGSNISIFGGAGNDSLAASANSNVTLFGGTGTATLTATNSTNVTLFGGTGNATLASSGGSNVFIFGGAGADSLTASGGTNVTLFGGTGSATLTASNASNVTLFGGTGNATLTATGGSNISIFGGNGSDSLAASGSTNVTMFGGSGSATLTATNSSNVTLFGGTGNATLTASGGSNISIFGGAGNDSLAASGSSNVTMFGGSGSATLTATNSSNVTLFGGTGNATLTSSGGSNISIFGGAGNDSLASSGGTNITLFGGTGNATLTSSGGSNVTLFGGTGNDSLAATGGTNLILFGGNGSDTLTATNGTNVTLFGGSGNATLTATGGSSISIFGGSGNDSLAATGGTSVTLFGGAGSSTLTSSGGSNLTLFGGTGNDSLAATNGSNIIIFGGTGNSTLTATNGTNVTLFGGSGNATLTSSGGSSVSIFGGSGNDSLAASGGTNVTLFGGAGNSTLTSSGGTNLTLFGGSGNDSLAASGGTNVVIFGGSGTDTLAASSGSNVTLFGGSGNATVTASNASNVTLFGGSGNDSLASTNGSNVSIFGGTGSDTLTATNGSQVTLFSGTGSDLLTANGGANVSLFGGPGNDTLVANGGTNLALYGRDGNNTYELTGTVSNPLTATLNDLGTIGQDLPLIDDTTLGINTLEFPGVSGITLDLSKYSTGSDSTLQPQTLAQGLTLALVGPFQNVMGTPGNDLIKGNDSLNSIFGGAGNDTLMGGTGAATLQAGTGNDSLMGGTGNNTYVFSGGLLGNDTINTASSTNNGTLDFSGLGGPVTVDISSGVTQTISPGILTLTLVNPLSIANVIDSAFNDSVHGNSRDNQFTFGAGSSTINGAGGHDSYFFRGSGLGSDLITDSSATNIDTLNFLQFAGGPVNINLSLSTPQTVSPGNLTLTLTDPLAFYNVVGSRYNDVIVGNSNPNILIGAGGQNSIVGGNGNDTIQGDLTQVVYLDFSAPLVPGTHAYSAAEQQAILQRVQQDYSAFDFTFTLNLVTAQQLSQVTGGQFITLRFNRPPSGGEASELDFGNLNLGGGGTIDVVPLLGDAGQPAATSADYVALSAEIAAHETGHLVGLRHGDAFGPIGSGIYSGVDPTLFFPTYTGPTNATETVNHIMASPDALGVTLFNSVSGTFFGEREDIKLAFANSGVTINEQTAANHSFATAQALGILPGLSVPNTLLSGVNVNQSFSVTALDVVGQIKIDPNTQKSADDYYSFLGTAGEVMNFQVMSTALTRITHPIDSILRLFDANGKLLAFSDDDFETKDAWIIDYTLPATGLYYVQVDTFTPDGIVDFNVGPYELFMYSFAAGPNLGGGDTLVGGTGNDLMMGGTGNDLFIFQPGSIGHDSVIGGGGNDLLDLTGSPGVHIDELIPSNMRVILGDNFAPVFARISVPTVNEGSVLSFSVTATDADLNDQLSYSLAPVPGSSHPFPTGAAIDPITGLFAWDASDEGTYAVRIIATDLAGKSTVQDITFTVANAPPVVSLTGLTQTAEGGAFTGTGSFADASSDTWTATVNYGDNTGDQPLTLNPDKTFTLNHVYTDEGNYTITVKVVDDDGGVLGTGSATMQVSVGDVQPVVSNLPPAAILEGGSFSSSGSFTDPSSDHWTATVDYGDGSGAQPLTLNSQAFMLAHTYIDEGTYTVTVRVSDDDHTVGVSTTVVTVNNVPPVVTSLPAVTVHEGQTATVQAGFTDPGSADTFTYHWHIVSSNGQAIPDMTTPTPNLSFVPADDGTYSVFFTVTDDDGASASGSTTVTALNVGPSNITLTPSAGSINEGGSLTLGGSFRDPGLFDAHTVVIAWGDGTPNTAVNLAAGVLSFTGVSHQYLDNPSGQPTGSFPISVTVTDNDGGSSSTSSPVQVNNVPPTATVGGAAVGVYGQLRTIVLGASDPSPTDQAAGFTYKINWGDNTLVQTVTATPGNGVGTQATHVYLAIGNFTVQVTATDKDGGVSSAASLTLTVNKDTTTTTVSVPTNPAAFGQPTIFSATVTANAPGSGTPTGSVDFFDTSTGLDLGSFPLSGGIASPTTSSLAPGLHVFTVSYSGDNHFLPSGTVFTVTIVPSTFVLNPTVSGALTASGNAIIHMPGQIVIDSSSGTALAVSGQAQITASSIQVVGGFSATSNTIVSPKPQTGIAPVADPLAGLKAPSTTGLINRGSVNVSSGSLTLSPGIYSQIKASGTASLTLQPGIYLIEGGGLSVSLSAGISGSGVFIYNAGSNFPNAGGNFGAITISGTGTFNLSPAASGPYAGVVIFQARDNTRALSLSGVATSSLTGVIYAANALLSLGGNAQFKSTLVVNTLSLGGNAALTQLAQGSDGVADVASIANTLTSGDLWVYVNNANGSLTADELARIQDTINSLDALLAPYSVTITQVFDSASANLILDAGTTSACGGAANGVLGCYNPATSEITLIVNWNWYAGADPTQIGPNQYDFQTTVTHEFGHALGLGGASDPSSPMFEILAAGVAHRTMTVQDLNIPYPPQGADPLTAAAFAQEESDGSTGLAGRAATETKPFDSAATVTAGQVLVAKQSDGAVMLLLPTDTSRAPKGPLNLAGGSAGRGTPLASAPDQNGLIIVSPARDGDVFRCLATCSVPRSVSTTGAGGRRTTAQFSHSRAIRAALDGWAIAQEETRFARDSSAAAWFSQASHSEQSGSELWSLGLVMGVLLVDQIFAAADERDRQVADSRPSRARSARE
jgi:Ca2+-binding RTX toxin-like protein